MSLLTNPRARALATYALAQLQQPSTWRGLTLIATSAGVALHPDQAEAITAGGLFAAGAIAALFPDRMGGPR